MDLCGHATLATAYVIFKELGYSGQRIVFNGKSGKLYVDKTEKGLRLEFPAWASQKADEQDPRIAKAFGRAALEIYKGKKWVAVFDDPNFIRTVNPDIVTIKSIECQGVVITAPGDNGIDFVSRYFGPQLGIDEDPVTGAAHCLLTPIWAEKTGKTQFIARQVSRRGGEILCELQDDRVLMTGQAALYMKGEIYIGI